jgi:hypothetical protein
VGLRVRGIWHFLRDNRPNAKHYSSDALATPRRRFDDSHAESPQIMLGQLTWVRKWVQIRVSSGNTTSTSESDSAAQSSADCDAFVAAFEEMAADLTA